MSWTLGACHSVDTKADQYRHRQSVDSAEPLLMQPVLQLTALHENHRASFELLQLHTSVTMHHFAHVHNRSTKRFGERHNGFSNGSNNAEFCLGLVSMSALAFGPSVHVVTRHMLCRLQSMTLSAERCRRS